jgi:UPF0755 protein
MERGNIVIKIGVAVGPVNGRGNRKLFKKLSRIALLLVAALAIGAFFSHRMMVQWSTATVPVSSPVTVEFPRGTRLPQLATALHEQRVISSPIYFQLWVRFITRDYSRYQAGVYRFDGPVSPESIRLKLIAGDVFVPVVAQIVIPEGFTVKKVVDRLLANGIGSRATFEKLIADPTFLRDLKIPSNSLEGFLYPATYRFTDKLPTGEQAIRRMVSEFWANLPVDYEARVNERGLTLLKAVTFASLIELETMFEDEKPLVSEVIWRRLKTNQFLGIDAALIYGIQDYDGDIKWKHLRDASNPYNLRKHRGFPPTPIGSPSASSLKAVLSPAQKGYNYYVLEADGSGKHRFAKTLDEHNANVERYLKAIRAKGNAETLGPVMNDAKTKN